jgi:hypothetical protein
MMRGMKECWLDLKKGAPGERFVSVYDTHGSRHTGWTRALYLGVALISFLIGIVLAFIPGPAILFFAITAALLATQSRAVARKLDAAELKGREWLHKWHAWRERKRKPPAGPNSRDATSASG